jgi:hypothetical protein
MSNDRAVSNNCASPEKDNSELEACNVFEAKRAQRLQARTITAGDMWRQYKGGVYRIVAGDARKEINGERVVIYAAVTGEVWVRLRIAFLNEVAPGVPRFRRLDPAHPERFHETESLS